MLSRMNARKNRKTGWMHLWWIGALMVLTSPAMMAQPAAPSSKQTYLTLRDAITMALENNRDLEIERLNTQIQEYDLQAARGVYDPSLTSSIYYERQTLPVASILAGGDHGRLRTTEF